MMITTTTTRSLMLVLLSVVAVTVARANGEGGDAVAVQVDEFGDLHMNTSCPGSDCGGRKVFVNGQPVVEQLLEAEAFVDAMAARLCEASSPLSVDATPGPDSASFSGVVLAPNNNKLYMIPYGPDIIPIVDPLLKTVDTTTLYQFPGAVRNSWVDGVLSSTGLIVGVPGGAKAVLVIDPFSNTAEATSLALNDERGFKWHGGVLADNGFIYCIPNNADTVLAVYPEKGLLNTFQLPATIDTVAVGGMWRGGVKGRDGRIYGIPGTASSVLVIDPATNTFDVTSVSINVPPVLYRWQGGVLASNGLIYVTPYNAEAVLVIDPQHGTTSMLPLTSPVKAGWAGAVVNPVDGRIYMLPYDARHVLIVDPATNTVDETTADITNLAPPYHKWWNGAYIEATRTVYGFPRSAQGFLGVDADLASVCW
ncbi:hypothetical protein PTSG_09043 [Salpingoeca rosetta]|uniref:Uncharacterized protein n=1 Tax=Salpingoeca rosetta (strain ATCC 50818 / BSB-021) TaxID=946362 RepID=F2UM17_SALR5|nr:uncharacterized protein PTSG_09043 [Salpingoeca rosetta]EGD78166.1 hypothetical protein PTSG_09043 [Salpingoeca rosetta]|eukprot:XP_004989842.1 hypothetical protein PTSG_09043 [Salpingoeca rosetta]